MKFLVDEGIALDIVKNLQKSYEVLSVKDTELQGQDDKQIIAFTLKHNYVFLTHEKSFMRNFYLNYGVEIFSLIILEVVDPYPITSLELLANFLDNLHEYTINMDSCCLFLIKKDKVEVVVK